MAEVSKGFAALWLGSRPVVTRGGYVHSFLVKFPEQDMALEILGGSWEPDRPVECGIMPIAPVKDGTP